MTDNPSKIEIAVLLEFGRMNSFPHAGITEQIDHLKVFQRKETGAGIYTYFDDYQHTNDEEIKVTGVAAGYSKGKAELGFVLYLRNGMISMLEGFSYIGDWPDDLSDYRVFLA